ncbi:MAG TPA: DoxX family protein [Chitinophagaceae bacterium]|nr:DoxX family protein [Chitinophagaceae bacterium]
MKKLLSVSYRDWAFDLAMLLLRLCAGVLIIPYGYAKLIHFADKKDSFTNFMGIGSPLSLALVIFAEFFCGMLIVLGLFTRLAAIPLIITMGVVLVKVNHWNIFNKDEHVAFFLTCFIALFLCGPGRASADGLINK